MPFLCVALLPRDHCSLRLTLSLPLSLSLYLSLSLAISLSLLSMANVSCWAVYAVSYEHFVANDDQMAAFRVRMCKSKLCTHSAAINTSSHGQEGIISQAPGVCVYVVMRR